MRKDIKEALNEKMSVELPDALKSENIVKELKRTGEITELGPKKRKSFNAKRLVPAAASLLLAVGLLGVYLANPLGGIKLKSPAEDKQAVTVCDSYDEVYAKFDRIKNEQKKKSIKDFFNFDKVSAPLEGIETEDKNYGETNTQESGVGEGDVIKTDGEYIYALTDYGRSFHIVDCRGGKTKPLSSVFFNDGNGLGNEGINEMYIYGDYAVLVGEKFGKDADRCYTPYGSNSWTVVKIYDISDKAAPKKINEFCYAGSPSSSRMIGSILYCVSAYSVNINGDLKEYCIPEIEKDGEFKKIPANCISVIEDTVTPSYIIVSAYDTEKGGEPSVKAVLGSCQNIYATAENLFVAEMPQMKNECTKIYKFAYTESGVEFKAAGEVPGQLRDRFSMGSQDEYLRAATMSYDKLIRDTVNGLYILDGDMKIAGSVENLAKGESIRSVRFVGTTAYIVTFRQTDPLFVIDTSDPHNPKVSGALKITGYSEYLHPAADGLLIGVGRDGTQDGANEACKVSLFDVSDPCNPKEISKISVVSMGEMGAVPYVYTPVGNNHKLFINLPDGEFAVMFDGSLYVRQYNFLVERKYFVRYKIEDSALEEVGRYVTAEGTEYIAGATYIGDTFYILARDRYSAQDVLYSYSLKTNEPTETVVLNGVQPKLNSPAS